MTAFAVSPSATATRSTCNPRRQKSLNVRGVVDDPKVSTHSLRHNMKDRLRKAGVSKIDQDLILGHTMGGIGEAYGGDEARLEVAAAAMKKAFSL